MNCDNNDFSDFSCDSNNPSEGTLSKECEVELTTEQKFALAKFAVYVKELPREEAQKRLVELYTESFHRHNTFKKEYGQRLGIFK